MMPIPASKAFTLIELLIVVAIIAILAAIAVPNFLEAQTRSKISRVQSDLRTYATALESYTVDNTRVPPGFTESNLGVGNRQVIYRRLTTPVAYLTSLPRDPFGERIPDRNEAQFYFYNTFYDGGSYRPNDLHRIRAKGYNWVLYSLGPTGVEGQPWIEDMLIGGNNATAFPTGRMIDNIYDPTNGTVSRGKIYRTNKGLLTMLE